MVVAVQKNAMVATTTLGTGLTGTRPGMGMYSMNMTVAKAQKPKAPVAVSTTNIVTPVGSWAFRGPVLQSTTTVGYTPVQARTCTSKGGHYMHSTFATPQLQGL
jgi:hypothetical protein